MYTILLAFSFSFLFKESYYVSFIHSVIFDEDKSSFPQKIIHEIVV